jgi:hypothetical protein
MDGTEPIEGLRETLAKQVLLYEQLLALSQRQSELARAMDLDNLVPILDEKETVIEEITQSAAQLGPLQYTKLAQAEGCEAYRDNGIKELVNRRDQLLRSIAALEQDSQAMLRIAKRRLAEQLSDMGSAREARESYCPRRDGKSGIIDRKM